MDGKIAVNWVDKIVGWRADCWAGRMAMVRVVSRTDKMAVKMTTKTAD